MATLYYNAAVDENWATLGNWWTDSGFTTQASSLPTSSDDVKIYSNISSNAGSTPTVNSMVVYGGSYIGINMTCVTFCEFIDESILGNGATITASSGIFGGDAVGDGYVDGTFTGISYLYGISAIRNGGIINGTTYFNNGSDINSGGTLNGSGIFIDDGGNKTNNGTINGYASGVFNNDGGGIINGNAVFLKDSGFNQITGRNGSGGTVNGSGIFYNDTTNFGTINFAATFYNTSRNAGVIGTNATFNDSSYNVYDFYSSYYGSVNGNATFNNSSYNDGAVVMGTATFNNNSFNAGYIIQLATFNNSSYNSLSYVQGNVGGKCNGGATYNHDSYQQSALNDSSSNQFVPFTFGTATFRDRSINYGQCPGTVVFAHGKGVNGSSILGIV